MHRHRYPGRAAPEPRQPVPPHRRGPYPPAAWPTGVIRAIARWLRALGR